MHRLLRPLPSASECLSPPNTVHSICKRIIGFGKLPFFREVRYDKFLVGYCTGQPGSVGVSCFG